MNEGLQIYLSDFSFQLEVKKVKIILFSEQEHSETLSLPRPTLCIPYCNTLRWLVGRLQMIASDLILNFMVSGLIITHY